MLRWIIILLAGIFLVCIVGLRFFFYDTQPNTLEFEVAKALLQLGVVSVIGAIVSLFTFEYQRDRLQRDKDREVMRIMHDKERELERVNLEYREELLKSTLAKTMAAYGAIKKARRFLRARAIVNESDNEQVVLGTVYDSYMDMINGAQLSLENLSRDIRTSAPAFHDPHSLVTNLRSMDTYLGDLVKEYETRRKEFAGEIPVRQLSELPELKKFLESQTKEFENHLVIPYHKVQEGIRSDLLHPKLISPHRT
jgi:hypothetical protein